jgi:hypothetical protein
MRLNKITLGITILGIVSITDSEHNVTLHYDTQYCNTKYYNTLHYDTQRYGCEFNTRHN